nr:hypothetical protein [Variovorax sp. SRS16]
MLDSRELKNFWPAIMTPSHDGKFFQNYVVSLMHFIGLANQTGMRLQLCLQQGESLVTRARNNCVATFLSHPEWTHLFWIDADIGFSAEAATRLLLSDYDIACGVYPLKREEWPAEGVPASTTRQQFEATYTRYAANTDVMPGGTPNMVDLIVQPDGFMRVTEAPTGFMVIKRRVFERLIESYPEMRYVPDSLGVPDEGRHYRFFDVMVDPVTRRYLSEDYGFCRLWSGLGESIYIDANSNLTHQGSKTYRGDFATSLKTFLPNALGAPAGSTLRLHGAEYLKPNAFPGF